MLRRLARSGSLVLATQADEAAGSAAVTVSRRQIPPPSLVHDSSKYDRELPLVNTLFGQNTEPLSDIYRSRFEEVGAFANFSCPCTDPTCIEKACSSIKPVQPPIPKKAKTQNASSNSVSDLEDGEILEDCDASSGTASTPAATSLNTDERRPYVYSRNRSGAMKVIARWLRLDADAIDGVVATAGASEAAPEAIDGYIEDSEVMRLASEALTDATMIAMDLKRPLEDGDIRTVGVFHGLVEFLGLHHIDISEEIEALRTSLDCPVPPLLQSNPAHVEGAKHCAFIAAQLDGKQAFDDGGAAAVYRYTMPMRLIPVAVRALPVDDQAAVAYLLRKERLEYLEGLERPADAPRKCPGGCGTVVHSVAAARAHLRGSVPCAWRLVFNQLPKDEHYYCQKDCGNAECPRKEGGMWPFLQKHHRDKHETRQGVRIFCDGGCRFGAKCPHIYERPFNTVRSYRRHRDDNRDQERTRSRVRLAGYVPGVEVEVDYEGSRSIGDRRRREPFNKRYGRIEDSERRSRSLSILFFDTLETETFREGYTLNDVLGVLPPYKVAKRKPHIGRYNGKAVLCGTKRKASA